MPFPEALSAFLEHKKGHLRPRSYTQLSRNLTRFHWTKAIDKITHDDVATAIEAIEAPSQANHCFVDIGTFFNWCVPRYLKYSPCTGLKAPHKSTARARVLSDAEVKSIFATSSENAENEPLPRLPVHFCTIVKLLICLGCRRGEAAALRWSWISDDRISWPPEVMKNARSHWLPLLPFTKSVLATVPKNGDLLFPARGKDTPFNGWGKAIARLWELSGIEDATLHDIRRSWASANAAWAAPHILERALGHVSGTISGVAAVYNRFQYEKELTACYQQWESHLKKLLDLA